MARPAELSNGEPEATKSFCMSTTIMAVVAGSMCSTVYITHAPSHSNYRDSSQWTNLHSVAPQCPMWVDTSYWLGGFSGQVRPRIIGPWRFSLIEAHAPLAPRRL